MSSIIFNSSLFLSLLSSFANNKKGFLIIPKKVEQNQTRIFDRDKVTSAGNFTAPNAISDSSKSESSFKSFKPNGSDGVTLSNATNHNSSNQLADVEESTYFSTANFTNVTSQVGSIVEIPCNVHHLGEGTVSVRASR